MSYDDWKLRSDRDQYTLDHWYDGDPDDDRGYRCATPDCPNELSLPEWDIYCPTCRDDQQARADAYERWLVAQERKARAR
jgi:hypothetical protein